MKYRYLLLLLFPFWTSCSNSELYAYGEHTPISGDLSTDFVKITTHDKVVEIKDITVEDSDGKNPAIKVELTYDFYLEKHEVTCKEYTQFLKSATCNNDSLPVTNVTFIDAILFANEKSKAEGYDTAYTYTSVSCDDGSCTQIEGFSFQPNVEAYRLPTEAEWILAARQGWDIKNSWYASNAKSNLHSACSKGHNTLGICDMEGNVSEWVNDWFGNVWDTTVTNFIGAANGGSLGERIIKGGNFHMAESGISPYSRGDVYTVTSSTTSDYLGFRLAFGKIPDALWLSKNPNSTDALPTYRTSSVGSVRKKTGTFRTKIAFRHDISGSLAYIDYSSHILSPLAVLDTINTFHPDISPDGQRVAFCTKPEGVNGQSNIYVRDLNKKGSHLVKLDVENAAIPRWKVLDSKDTVIIYVSSASNNKYEPSFLSKSTWMVPFSNGKFGEPQKLFDGAYHGGVGDDLKFAVTGSSLLRVRRSDLKDTVWYNSEQACNVSLAKDGSNRILFLDFGGKEGRKFVGKNYGVHEQILIMDSTGKLIQNIPAPKGYTFDHPEWVDSHFITAMLTTPDGTHEKIVLINLNDSSIMELIKGDELWHPCIWIGEVNKTESPLEPDSAAIYWNDDDDPLLATKMNAFWAIADSIEVMALGSSRTSIGFATISITYGVPFNMATIPNDMDVNYYLAKNYVFPHCKNLEYIILALDLDLWSEKSGVNVKRNILSIPGCHYDANHDFWKKGNASHIIEASKQQLSEQLYLEDIAWLHGFVKNMEVNSWTYGGSNPNSLVSDSTWSDRNMVYKTALQQIEDIIKIAQEKGIKVIGVVYPQSPEYAKTGAFGRHGMRRSTAISILDNIAKFSSTYPNFILMDENKMGQHDYADRLAYDYDHLNMYGAFQLSARIDSLLWALGKKKE